MLKPTIRKGLSNLKAKPYAPPKTANSVVRVYYMSQDDEMLCTDTEKMTHARAVAMISDVNRSTYACHAELLGDSSQREARLVVFPSHAKETK